MRIHVKSSQVAQMTFALIACLPASPPLLPELAAFGMDTMLGRWSYIASLVASAVWYLFANGRENAASALEEQQRHSEVHGMVVRSITNLTELPSAEIRRRVAALAELMRTFEQGTQQVKSVQFEKIHRRVDLTASAEQQVAAFESENEQLSQVSEKGRIEFQRAYLPDALALRGELARRLAIYPPYPHDSRAIALDYGLHAGVAPISDAAAYLEDLAGRLP